MIPPCSSEYLFSSFQPEPTRFCKHWVPHLSLLNSHQTKALPSHPTCPDSSGSVSHREAAGVGCVDPIPYSHYRRARGEGQTDDVVRVAPAYKWVTRLSRRKGSEVIAGEHPEVAGPLQKQLDIPRFLVSLISPLKHYVFSQGSSTAC